MLLITNYLQKKITNCRGVIKNKFITILNIKFMNFRTIVNTKKSSDKIDYSSKIMFLGSCFTDNIGQKFKDYFFDVDINPFGTIYNPLSILNNLETLTNKVFLSNENLFLDNADAPDEETQYQQLREILTAVGKPVTIRTFDIGGDKPVPYVNQAEKNPFLGVRGVRLYSQLPELFENHIRAVLRAAAGQQAKIMFPMIASLEDFSKTKQWVESIHTELTEQGIAHQWPIPIGMMVETPAAALLADEFSQLADFFSIGTNDLTQYLMAADRGDVALAGYNNPLSPPVLDMVQRVIKAAEKPSIPVGLCGDPGVLQQALPALIQLGLRAISLSLSSIPEAKQIIANLDDVAGSRKTLAR